MPRSATARRPSDCRRPPDSAYHLSADLAGRAVALSADVPAIFDSPMAPHHRMVGRWVASREMAPQEMTRAQARRHIGRTFDAAVLDILQRIEIVNLRVVVLHGEDHGPPAIVVICDSIGQIDLGWIETSEAPIPWRASAYQALGQTLGCALPIFGYQDLFDEIAIYYWDGETDDGAARQRLIDYQGADADDLDELSLPSTMNARRPAWMIETSAAQQSQIPIALRRMLHRLRDAHEALRSIQPDLNAWRFDSEILSEYLPGIEDCSSLPPMTLVPFEQFARELDDVARHGMELGFMDVAGLCPLPDADRIDAWFASFRLGAEFLLAAQALIRFDPANL
jgi:hypothetical protein